MERQDAVQIALEIAKEKGMDYKGIEEKQKKAAKIFSRKGQAQEFSDRQPIFYDKSGLWWLWSFEDKCWKLTDEVDILNVIEEATGADIITSQSRNEILNSLKQEGRKKIPKESPATLIQFKNGLIDINDPTCLIEPNPSYFITNPIPWPISDKEETPIMDKIFKDWVGASYVLTLYEILAYLILPDYPIHRIFALIGAGMNGKTKYQELTRKFVGSSNVTSTELDVLLTSRFEITRLHKKLVCQMGETNFAEMNRTSILKKLSGGDLIGFEYKGKTPFEDKNYAKIIISTNNLPTTSDKTIGFYRRWLIIDFPNHFTEAKDILKDIPEEEYSNLARKCVNILVRLLKERSFTNEGSPEERMRKYEDRSDPLEKFIKEYTSEDYEGYIWKFEFEKRLNEWCKENRFRQISEVAIGKKMKERGILQELKQAEWLQDGQNKRIRAWIGVNWKENVLLNESLGKDEQDEQDEHPIYTQKPIREVSGNYLFKSNNLITNEKQEVK